MATDRFESQETQDDIAELEIAVSSPTSMTNEDLSSYTIESGKWYITPSDGYAWINAVGSSSAGTLQISDRNKNVFTYFVAPIGSVFGIYVKKGMGIRGSGFAGLRFIKFNY